jgi:putative transposase
MNRKIVFAPGEYYHIYNRGVEKRDVFMNDEDHKRFQRLLYLTNGEKPIIYRIVQGETLYDENVGKKISAVGAYVLMPNHFHLLLKETKEGGITEFLRKLTTGYTMYFNKKYERVGPLFQGAFKAEHVDNDEYLKYLFSYIHLNPAKTVDIGWDKKQIVDRVKAKAHLRTFPYSSYPDLIGQKRPESGILIPKEFPGYFDGRMEFEDFIDEWIRYNEDEMSVTIPENNFSK